MIQQKFADSFRKAIPAAFQFLESGYGFTLQQQNTWLFQAQSRYLQIRIQCDTGQLILVSITPEASAVKLQGHMIPKEIGLAIIVRCLDPSVEYSPQYCKNDKEFQREINTSAQVLHQCCEPLLNGDFTSWLKIESCAQEEVQNWRMQSKMRVENAPNKEDLKIQEIRNEAHQAFHSKEYARSIVLYTSITNYLTKLEDKRLTYMKDKIRSD
ncbi:MAG: hypothetical protein ABI210_11005 [Abditibacteriaceae bacterium]